MQQPQQSTALVSSSPYPSGNGIFGLLNGKANGGPQPPSPPVPTFQTESLGSADPRPNIVKRGLIQNGDALSLVNYFHSRLSPWLFGYRLQFTKFPYIPQGPSVITPFILSVMCLVAAERVPNMHEHRPTLAREVTQLLVNSPADSFISTLDQPFGGASGNKDDDGEEELDPELGIGPEEIVGACILATFMTEREQAATIASSAFKWARGWIKWTSLTVPLPPTLGEVCGLLPVKRDATREDMARVWLLCYIVDGTEALQRDNPAAPRRDPMAYCHVLVPDSPLPGDSYSPHDILLTFHARLITLLRDWYHRAGAGAQAAAHARLASSINASLEWWRADLESHSLAAEWMRHVDLFWEFARMLVNATSAKSLSANPRLRAASWAHGVEAAVGLLEKCSSWPGKDELANLPPCYLSMITLAGSVLVDAIKDQGVAECPFQAADAVPLLKDVADMLGAGGLPHQHVSRTAGATLRGYAEQLARFV
ncbi:hypothetical protein VHUM_02836 [Vanrija humicola]|uniref:Transcription factor domain-containing protein n=1 Tax=Vanrija humicola TaxID=5417 RepID=A0A7D8V104_VANHU|nr:hypothetical protein VHUM_02836 [Vanrija humicola]